MEYVSDALQLEQRNASMNLFIARVVSLLKESGINAVLVKGQGVALCYNRPQWRTAGDVDLLLDSHGYEEAKTVLMPMASDVDSEDKARMHLGMTIDSWVVELHGTLRSRLWARVNKMIDELQARVIGGEVRVWMNDGNCVALPGCDADVVLVFSHILQHFFFEGIGLRQVCDWCRLLWTFRGSLDRQLLEFRLRRMRIMTEWMAFAALAVKYLGMPAEAMPLYVGSKRWGRRADRIMAFVLETGNFGHNRDYSYYKKYPYLIYKAISLWRHIRDSIKFYMIFPLDSMKVLWRRIVQGIAVVAEGR